MFIAVICLAIALEYSESSGFVASITDELVLKLFGPVIMTLEAQNRIERLS